jgi:hypothetical protein
MCKCQDPKHKTELLLEGCKIALQQLDHSKASVMMLLWLKATIHRLTPR